MTLTLKEAIKIVQHYQVEGEAPCGGVLDDALKLLIKAGEREVANRENPDFILVGQLQGETWE